MPTLHRLPDDDPATLTASLEAVWAAGDAAVVLPPGDPPPALLAWLEGRRTVPRGTALVVTTSGSTGSPRAVVLPRPALDAAVAGSLAHLGCSPGERWALALPVHHIAGLMVLLRTRALGTDAVIVPPGDPSALTAAARTAQHVAVVPTQLARALDGAHDLAGFRTVLVGGGPVADGLLDRARTAGVRVVASYGMTETCGGCVYDGVALAGTEVALTDDGRLRLRGPSVASRLLDGTRLTDTEGWFTSSDLGRITDGRLEVLGRADDAIVTGGTNVDPVAVTASLLTHPAVVDATVIGVPDPVWGSSARAVVVLRGPVTLAALRDHVASSLGRVAAPRELLVVERIPRDALGKLPAEQRTRLRSRPPTARIGS